MTILSTSNDYRGNGSLTLPTGIAEGDLLTVVCVTGNGGETISLSSGFTNIESGSVLGVTWEVFQKVAGASEPNPVLSTTRTTRCLSFRSDGVAGGQVVATGYGGTTSTFIFPDATVTNSADLVRVAATQLSGANVVTPPTGTELIEILSSSVGVGAWASTASAGAVGTDTLVIDSAKRGAAFTLVLENQAAGLTIDSTDATMQRGTNFELVCSGATTAPTTANTTLSNGNDTLTPTSVTGSDPYTLTFAVGDLTKQVDATGYDWTLTVDVETATTGNIPLVIQAGYTKVDLVNPVTTNASLLFGYTGDAPVTGDDLEYDVTSVLNSGVTFGVTADGVWTITEASEGDWTTAITVDRRVVQADGTIGTEATMTFDPTTNNGGGSIQAFRPFSFTKLIKTLMEDGSYSGTGNTIIMNWLVDEGIKRTQLNEMFYKYLGNLGYTGNLNERIKQWENSAINNGFPYTIPFGLS